MSDRYAAARQHARRADRVQAGRPAGAGQARALQARPAGDLRPRADRRRRAAHRRGQARARRDPRRGVRALPGAEEQTFKALVFDASGITDVDQLRAGWAFFAPAIRRVQTSGRVIVLGTPPDEAGDPRESSAQWALDGLVRSIGKEVRKGASAQPRVRLAGSGGRDRLDAPVPAVAEIGLCVRADDPRRRARRGDGRDRLAAAAGREGRAGDGRLARDRRGDRERDRSGRRPRRGHRRARAAARPRGGHQPDRRFLAGARHHVRGGAPPDHLAPARASRRARRRRPQRRRHPRQDARPDERGRCGAR